MVACAGPRSDAVAVWLTTPDRSRLLARQPDLPLEPAAGASSAPVIEVNPARSFQTMVGFGAAFTDAASWLIETKLSAPQRRALLTELFSPTRGIGLGFMRVTMGASDLSRSHWSYDDVPPGRSDPALALFSIARDSEAMLPLILQARAVNPDLVLLASPWSPPGWMKTSGSMIGGRLRPDAYDALARYFLRFLRAYDSAGVPVQYITVQNEPAYEPGDYPGMRFPAAARAVFVGRHLGPLLRRHGVQTRILDWDHNWDMPEQPLAVLADSAARRYVAGVAWHCYAGDVGAQTAVHERYPAKDAFLTECSGGTWQEAGFAGALRSMAGDLVIDGTRNWARGVAFWSLALDPAHGPHAGGCATCRGVVTIDPATGAVQRNAEYYALGHAARFVDPGAVRIASTSDVAGLKSVAFLNRDGQTSLLILNTAATSRDFAVREGSRAFRATLPAGALATYVWSMSATSRGNIRHSRAR